MSTDELYSAAPMSYIYIYIDNPGGVPYIYILYIYIDRRSRNNKATEVQFQISGPAAVAVVAVIFAIFQI